ncbi:hypothetical protein FLA_3200 [Filimonas lacunae]|nr:hypothetical protein FLA_3200 [Filimonas lacunae]
MVLLHNITIRRQKKLCFVIKHSFLVFTCQLCKQVINI